MINYRKATAQDINQVARINIVCWPQGSHARWGIELTEKYYAAFFDEGGIFVIAEDQGCAVGYVMGHYKGSRAREKFALMRGQTFVPDEKYIRRQKIECQYDSVLLSLSVLPEYRERGIGKKLISLYLEKIDQHMPGCSCCLSTQMANLAAQHAYEACGFKKIKVEDGLVWYGYTRS